MNPRTFDLDKQNGGNLKMLGIGMVLLIMVFMFGFVSGNENSVDGLHGSFDYIVSAIMALAMFLPFAIIMFFKRKQHSIITFTDGYIEVKQNKKTYKILLKDNPTFGISGYYLNDNHIVDLTIFPLNVKLGNLDSTTLKYCHEYFGYHNLIFNVDNYIRDKVDALLSGADTSGKLDNLYNTSLANFFYWVKKPSTIYNYASMLGTKKTGKSINNAPHWVLFLGLFVITLIITTIFALLLILKGLGIKEIPVLIVSLIFGIYVMLCIIFIVIPVIIMIILSPFLNKEARKSKVGLVISFIISIISILMIVNFIIDTKSEFSDNNKSSSIDMPAIHLNKSVNVSKIDTSKIPKVLVNNNKFYVLMNA